MKSPKSPAHRRAGSRSEPTHTPEQSTAVQPSTPRMPDWFRQGFEHGCARLEQTAHVAAVRKKVLFDDEIAGRSEDHLAYAS